MDVFAEIKAIADDNTSGATELAARACDVLCAAVGDGLVKLWEVAQELLAAQPAMVSIINVVNTALLAADNAPETGLSFAVRRHLERLKTALHERPRAIASAAWRLLPRNAIVITHSFSSVVLRWLIEARKRGRCAQVICTESRPMLEGVTLARRLAAEGVPVTLIADAAGPQHAGQVDAVGIGADGITPDGIINKIGTYPLALAACRASVPVYVLCGSEKVLGTGCLQPRLDEPKAPAELLAEPAEGVRVENTYFEMTPLTCLAAVVTERGVVRPSDLAALFDALPIHVRLRSRGS